MNRTLHVRRERASLKRFAPFCSLALLLSAACGREDSRSSGDTSTPTEESVDVDRTDFREDFDQTFIPQLGLSTTTGILVVNVATLLKASPAQGGSLPPAQKCALPAGTELAYTAAGASKEGHRLVTLSAAPAGCALKSGYVFESHVSFRIKANPDQEFPRVMKHILSWEGGCSDHPADRGGRTFKGITTERARMNGFSSDVCTMPHSMVLDIYREDYWKHRAAKYGWPLNLAIMNTEVNSGGGKAREFLGRMTARGVQGSLEHKATWFVDQQIAFYHAIVAKDATQRTFLAGWLNRSAHIQGVISGRLSLQSEAEGPVWTAKAMD